MPPTGVKHLDDSPVYLSPASYIPVFNSLASVKHLFLQILIESDLNVIFLYI